MSDLSMSQVVYEEERVFNTGNYESTRIRVGVTFNCTRKNAGTAYKKAKEFVVRNLDEEEELVRNASK